MRFEGNNYSEEWKAEAEKRGLSSVSGVPETLDAYSSDEAIALFTKLGLMTEREIEARTNVRLDTYTKKIQIESRVLADLAFSNIIPTAIKYQTSLINNVNGLKLLFSESEYAELAGERIELIKTISSHISNIKSKVNEMTEARKVANKIENEKDKALQYSNIVVAYIEDIRNHIDKLELIIDDEIWPLPKYREMLFTS